MALPVIVGLFALYVVATAWQARRALATTEPAARFTEAKRLLALSALGMPILVALILAL